MRQRIDNLEYRINGRCVEVWIREPEGEHICTVDRSLIKNLIAILTRAREDLY